ncbi:protein disulfide-isomerase A6 [Acrasis kona]|uniref:protein disulfide-isomerase n=1 Tax=Acrasis kona TaxID=1008807 RepID=A0AAW2Z451_9EUKA
MSRILLLVVALLTINCVLSNEGKPEERVPGIVEITSSNVDKYVGSSQNVFLEFYAPWCGHCKNLVAEYKIVGEAFEKHKPRDSVAAKVDCTTQQDVCQKFGVPEDYNSGRTAADILKYINQKDSNARLRVPGPISDVEDLDKSNFDKLVLDPENDVLVEFYAPWCGHCQKLAPDYEKVARAFRNEKNIIVAKVNADNNKPLTEKYGVTGYPTIKFFSKTKKTTPEDYNGDRSAEGFLKFLNERGGVNRQITGSLDDKAGLLEKMGDMVKSFLKASDKTAKEGIIKKAEDYIQTYRTQTNRSNAAHYVKAMKSILEKGEEYVSNEVERLKRLLSKDGAVKNDMVDTMTIRGNILRTIKSFIGK